MPWMQEDHNGDVNEARENRTFDESSGGDAAEDAQQNHDSIDLEMSQENWPVHKSAHLEPTSSEVPQGHRFEHEVSSQETAGLSKENSSVLAESIRQEAVEKSQHNIESVHISGEHFDESQNHLSVQYSVRQQNVEGLPENLSMRHHQATAVRRGS